MLMTRLGNAPHDLGYLHLSWTLANGWQIMPARSGMRPAASLISSAGMGAGRARSAAVVGRGVMLGWTQSRQHQQLATAYLVAAHELAYIRDLIVRQLLEQTRAAVVCDAERALSREYSLWRSSRHVQPGALE
jgi:hypothetical protein